MVGGVGVCSKPSDQGVGLSVGVCNVVGGVSGVGVVDWFCSGEGGGGGDGGGGGGGGGGVGCGDLVRCFGVRCWGGGLLRVVLNWDGRRETSSDGKEVGVRGG